MKHVIFFHFLIIEVIGLNDNLLVMIEDGKVIKLIRLLDLFLFILEDFKLICDLYSSCL